MTALRTFKPFAPAVLFRRARPADFLEADMKFSPSNHHDRECLLAVTGRVPLEMVKQAAYEAQDDMGEWAAANAESLRAGLADARMQQLADEETAHRRTVLESVQHMLVGDVPSCKGHSCHGARLPCRENCNPLPEMACTAGEEPPMPWWTPSGALFAAVAVGVILLGAWLY